MLILCHEEIAPWIVSDRPDTSVDLHSGYWQIAVDEYDHNKTVYYSRWPVTV